MKTITLTQGKVAFVDDEDYERLSQWKWHAVKDRNNYYASRMDYSTSKGRSIRMHREVLVVTDRTILVDHRNHNGLDNQKSNIRTSNTGENNCNRNKTKGSSKYLGVSVHKKNNRYVAHIRVSGKLLYLGSFKEDTEAATAYNIAATLHHKEFANLNIV